MNGEGYNTKAVASKAKLESLSALEKLKILLDS